MGRIHRLLRAPLVIAAVVTTAVVITAVVTTAVVIVACLPGAANFSGTGAALAGKQRQSGKGAIVKARFAKKRRAIMAGIKSWGYQLRNVTVGAIAASPFDLVVIDHARVGLGGYEARFSGADIAAMQRKPSGGRRYIIAYLSIGEAESYRFYWNKNWSGTDPGKRPGWLGDMNQQWERNYPVRYWIAQWQRIIYGSKEGYLDSIMAAGFDGIYLDRADVFEDWQNSRPTAQTDMVRFITDLTGYARRRNGKFIVVMQNAEELLQHAALRRAIDGIAKEDLYYGIEHGANANSAANIEWSLRHLKLARAAGRKVFLVGYVTDKEKAAKLRQEAKKHDMLVYFATRNLDRLMLPGASATVPPIAGPRPIAAPALPQTTTP